jgi:hypothetical protein
VCELVRTAPHAGSWGGARGTGVGYRVGCVGTGVHRGQGHRGAALLLPVQGCVHWTVCALPSTYLHCRRRSGEVVAPQGLPPPGGTGSARNASAGLCTGLEVDQAPARVFFVQITRGFGPARSYENGKLFRDGETGLRKADGFPGSRGGARPRGRGFAAGGPYPVLDLAEPVRTSARRLIRPRVVGAGTPWR